MANPLTDSLDETYLGTLSARERRALEGWADRKLAEERGGINPDDWWTVFLASTAADVAHVLTKGVSLGIIRAEEIPILGDLVEKHRTPDDRKSALRQWAEFGLIELPLGVLSPLGGPLGKLGTAVAARTTGGAVLRGAVRGATEGAAIGAAQAGTGAIRGEETVESSAAKLVGGAAFGGLLGAAGGKLEQLAARRRTIPVQEEPVLAPPEAPAAAAPAAEGVRIEEPPATTPRPSPLVRLKAVKPEDLERLLTEDPSMWKAGEKVYRIKWDEIRGAQPSAIDDVLRRTERVFREEGRRGPMSDAEVRRLADEIGIADLLALPPGALNREQGEALKAVVGSSAREIFWLAYHAADNPSDAVLAQTLLRQWTVHRALQGRLRRAKEEAGATLRQFGTAASPELRAARELETLTGSLDPEMLAQLSSTGMSPAQLAHKLARQITTVAQQDAAVARLTRFGQAASNGLIEAFMGALLSSPKTQVRNVAGNVFTAMAGPVERAFAARLHFGDAPGVVKGEALAMLRGEEGSVLYGLTRTVLDAWRMAKVAWRTGESAFGGLGKVEVPQAGAISAEAFGATGNVGRAVDWLGSTFRLPSRLMLTTDEFFKGLNYRFELHAQAWRRVAGQLELQGDEAAQAFRQLVENPTHSMIEAAQAFAKVQTFTNELGPLGQAILRASNATPVAKVFLPFVRTPTNILKYTWERTPVLDLLSRQVRADLGAGGVRRDLALAKMTMGTLLLGAAGALYHAGLITGAGPQDKRLRAELEGMGWQAESVKIGDTFYSYRGTDPLPAMFLSMAATLGDLSAGIEGEDAVVQYGAAAGLALTRVFANASYVQSIADALDAITSQDGGEWQRFMQRRAASLVPRIVADLAREIDPVRRDVDSIGAALRSQIPGLSLTLPARRNLKGEPTYFEGSLGPDIASPFFQRKLTGDPVFAELVRNRISLSPAPDFIGGVRPSERPLAQERVTWGVRLTPAEHDRYADLAGNALKDPGTGLGMWETLRRVVESAEYRAQSDGPDGGKAQILRDIVQAFREGARAQLLDEFPELRRRVTAQQVGRALALDPGSQPLRAGGRPGITFAR